jgi:hypothetical protein
VYTLLVLLRLYRLLAAFLPLNRAALSRLSGGEWDLVIAHDVLTMPVASRLTSRLGFIADLPEYAPRQGEESRRWRIVEGGYYRWIIRRIVSRARAVTTVSTGIVEEYRREFGIEAHLVINATPFHECEPGPVERPLRLVHSGAPSPARRLEVLIDAVKSTRSDVTLDFYLIEDGSAYFEELRQRASDSDRIRFNAPVPYGELVDTLNHYDVGVSILPPINFNHLWALPNKLFDYIQARLGVIVGPSPEMARVVRENGIGVVADDFTSAALTNVLDMLDDEQVAAWKAAADENARKLSSEKQSEVWRRLVDATFHGGN